MRLLALALMLIAPSLGFAGSDWVDVKAKYEVPAPEELKPFAWFELIDFKIRVKGDVRELKYSLPLELTGRNVEIHAEGPATDGGGYYEGPGARVACLGKSCRVQYPGLRVDFDEVRKLLQSRGIGEEEIEKRMTVLRHFMNGSPNGTVGLRRAGDPEGVIHFE